MLIGRVILMIATLAVLVAISLQPVRGRAQDDQYALWISTVLCDADPVVDQSAKCALNTGVVINIDNAGGQFLGTCTTEETAPSPAGTIAMCSVLVPFDIDVVVTEDVGTIPAGYFPKVNPQSYHTPPSLAAGGEPPDVAFVNVLEPINGGDNTGEEPVTGLPGTGTGAVTAGTDTGFLALAVLALAGLAFGLHRRVLRRGAFRGR